MSRAENVTMEDVLMAELDAKCGNCGEENDRPGCHLCSTCDDIVCPVCGRCTLLLATYIECQDGCKIKSHSYGTMCLGEGCGCEEFAGYTEEEKGERAKTKDKLEKWLSDGTSWIAVYENALLEDQQHGGKRIALCFDIKDFDNVKIGDRAPDSQQRIRWRYVLVAKCKTMEEALKELEAGQ